MIDRRRFLGLGALGVAALVGCDRAPAPAPTPTPARSPAALSTIATGLNVPWGLVFLPSGDALVSQRDAGSIVQVSADGTVTDLGQVTRPQEAGGEGGLLGLALDPDEPGLVYAYVSTEVDDRVVRFAWEDSGEATPILTGIPIGSRHHGGRLLFAPDKTLFVATGEAGVPRLAADRNSLGGKILRITRDGDPAPGNPFGNRTWSYGHRNVEGLAYDADGRLWASEFGDSAWDELNLIEKGGDFGWPKAEGDEGSGVRPKVVWPTSDCSPSGLAISDGVAYVAALRGECLWAVPLEGETAGEPRRLLEGHGRLRTVEPAPDGSLWVTTSNTDGRGSVRDDDDRILRFVP